MNLPSLPTDNLYKFLALSGLVLFVGSIYLSWIKVSEVNDRIVQVNGESRVYDLEAKEIDRLIEGLQEIFLKLSSLTKRDGISRDLNHSFSELIEDIQKFNSKIRNLAYELEKKEIQLDINEKHIVELHDRSIQIYKIGNILKWFGIALSIVGFILWYLKVQKPMDQLLRKKLESESSD